ncbi:MAG: cation transporter [Chloroflexota bacterium]
MASATLSIPTISCGHCEKTITEALTPMAGVRSVAVDIGGRSVKVDFDDRVATVDRMKEVLAEEEYPVEAVS